MLKIRNPFLFMLVCCAAIMMAPFVFLLERGFLSIETVRTTSAVLLVLELVIYSLWVGFFTNASVFVIVLAPIVMSLFRAFLSGLICIYVSQITELGFVESFYLIWFGSPIAFVVQVCIMIYMLPVFLTFAWPTCLVGTKYENLFTFDASGLERRPATAPEGGSIIGPAGGLYEVLSLKDLVTYFRKVTGLEGYAIFTSECLTYSHNMPVGPELDILGVRVLQLWESYRSMVKECELEEAQEMMIGTVNYQVYISPVGDEFYAIFIFNKTLSRDNCSKKLKVMLKSANSFLKARYA